MDIEIRDIIYSPEYEAYYAELNDDVREKYDYVEHIIKTIKVVSKKFVKHLEDTDLYEARMSVGNNEYMTILFAIDKTNFYRVKQGAIFELIFKEVHQRL